MDGSNKATEIIVKNIPIDWDEFDVFRVFSIAGIVYDIKLPHVPRSYSTRFCFVKYRLPSEAKSALNKFNGCSEIGVLQKKLKLGFDVKIVQDGFVNNRRRQMETFERTFDEYYDDGDHEEENFGDEIVHEIDESTPNNDEEVSPSKLQREITASDDINVSNEPESEPKSNGLTDEITPASKSVKTSSTRCTVCRKICEKGCPCKEAFYCGPECQKIDWSSHQEECSYYNKT